jgi:hypothetical protein
MPPQEHNGPARISSRDPTSCFGHSKNDQSSPSYEQRRRWIGTTVMRKGRALRRNDRPEFRMGRSEYECE